MKIEKRGSDNYRIRKMYKGQTYTVSFDHKPTQKEAMQAMADELDRVKTKNTSLTFQAACEEYIESKRNVLSPSTIRGYTAIMRQLPNNFLLKNIYDITAIDVQKEINYIAKDHSPKTVRNQHGFISSVLVFFCPNLKLNTTLPQKIKSEPYTPSSEDVKQILAAVKDTPYEIVIVLACYGMRRSEICALTPDDIDGDIVQINKALVPDEKQRWTTKATKTTSSKREIIIPLNIANKIKEQGYVYQGNPDSISRYLKQLEGKLGIPYFSLHKLRHYFASKMSALGVPDADILKLGGWETDYVMKSVYRHSMMEKEKNAKRDAAEKLLNSLFS